MTEETVKIENCRVAMKAALEAIQDYCGTGGPDHGNYIKFAGDIIEYPVSVREIMGDTTLNHEEQVIKMSKTQWAEDNAIDLCSSMFEGQQLEIDACIERLKTDLASAVLFQRLKQVQEGAYADRYE